MVDGEVAERKQDAASTAHPFLASVQRVFVRAVVRDVTQVGALGNVRSVNHIVKQYHSIIP